VRATVDGDAAGPADALAAVGVERHRFDARVHQVAVEDVEQHQHTHLRPGVADLELLVPPGHVGPGLSPDSQGEPHR